MKQEALKQNLFDLILEEQLKLGYERETIRLYYPLSSLNRILGTQFTSDEMENTLSEICQSFSDTLGAVETTRQKDRFCFLIPEEGGAYVHDNAGDTGFLSELIRLVASHASIGEIIALFHRYSNHVVEEKPETEEFDYLLYFEDKVPDDYYYCFAEEGHHLTYHRFLREDYQEMYEN